MLHFLYMNFTLEQYKAFPYVAWTLFIGFALFVGNLAMELYTITGELAESNVRIEQISNENATRLDAVETKLDTLVQ